MIHVIFDVDGVLIKNFHVDPARRYLWWEDPEVQLIEPAVMSEHFFKTRFPDVLAGKKDILDELRQAFQHFDSPVSAEDYLAHWLAKDSRVNHELLAALRRLPRDKVTLSLATNQEHQRANHLWTALNFKADFDHMFYAAQLGYVKPDAAFFHEVANRLKLSTDDTVVFFDDSPKCVETASTLGWQTVTFSEIEHFTAHPTIQSLLKEAA